MSILTVQRTITRAERDLAVIDPEPYARQTVRDQLHAALLQAHPIVVEAFSGTDLGGALIVRARAPVMDEEFITDLTALVEPNPDPAGAPRDTAGAITRMRLLLRLLRSAQDREP